MASVKYGENITIENAMRGKEGIKKYEGLKACGMKPHLILMDIKMPSMSGIEATKSILRIDRNAHIFVFSVFDDDEYDVEAKKSKKELDNI